MIVTAAGVLGVRGRIDPLIFRRASWNPLVTHLDESEGPAQDNGGRNFETGRLMKSGCLIGVVFTGQKGTHLGPLCRGYQPEFVSEP